MSSFRILLNLRRYVKNGHSLGTAYSLMEKQFNINRCCVVDTYCNAVLRKARLK